MIYHFLLILVLGSNLLFCVKSNNAISDKIHCSDQQYEQLWSTIQTIATLDIQDLETQLLPQLQDAHYEKIKVLMDYCLWHKHALDLAYELHNHPMLYELIEYMQAEIESMPPATEPVIGNVFMPNVDRYIVARVQWERKQTNAGFDRELFSRALTILIEEMQGYDKPSDNVLWSLMLDLKKIMDEGTDEQVDLYITSERMRLDAIGDFLKNTWLK